MALFLPNEKQTNKQTKKPKIQKGEVSCLRTEGNSDNTTELPKQKWMGRQA